MSNAILYDLRYALRNLRKNPGFAAVAIVTLALGIGANAAIFSVVDGVLLRPLSFAEPDRIVRVLHDAPEDEHAVLPGAFSPQDFEDLRRESSAYEVLAAYRFVPGNSSSTLLGEGAPEEVETALVSADFFAVFGVGAKLGRVPTPEENLVGANRVAVLSDSLWRQRFAADPGVVGDTVSLDGEPFTIVGVMPASFTFPSSAAKAWLPISLIGENDIPSRRDLRWMEAVGKLAPGATPETAAAETDAILRTLEAEYPDTNEGWGSATVQTLHDSLVGDVRPALLMLLGAVGLVLLIACANLANLLLVRGSARGRELAVRAALGADRARVIRQLLTESVALALLGGAVGIALAYFCLDTLLALGAGAIPTPNQVGLDARVVLVTLLASLATGIGFGLVPSLSASRRSVHDALNDGGRGATGSRRSHAGRSLLVTAQTALAVVLLIGAGLLIRSFWNMTHVDAGFNGENVLTVSVTTPSEILAVEQRTRYRQEILRVVQAIPGVLAAGGSKTVPLHGGGEPYAFSIPGQPEPVTPESGILIVTPGYFEALGIPVLQGRGFTTADEDAAANVLVVNEAMAKRYLPGKNPVGETLKLGDVGFRIVGLVGDVRNEGIVRGVQPAIYAPAALLPRSSLKLFIRTASDPLQVAADVRQAIWQVNPNQPISDIATMRQVMSETVSRPRFFTVLLALFAGLAVVLAALGVYGVIAYSVSRRVYEIGIRMALGARAENVSRMVIVQGILPALGGLALGLAAALAMTRALSSLLFEVGSADPATFAAVAALLLGVGLLASWLPARRAASVNPMAALRSE
jgi:predicted permease